MKRGISGLSQDVDVCPKYQSQMNTEEHGNGLHSKGVPGRADNTQISPAYQEEEAKAQSVLEEDDILQGLEEEEMVLEEEIAAAAYTDEEEYAAEDEQLDVEEDVVLEEEEEMGLDEDDMDEVQDSEVQDATGQAWADSEVVEVAEEVEEGEEVVAAAAGAAVDDALEEEEDEVGTVETGSLVDDDDGSEFDEGAPSILQDGGWQRQKVEEEEYIVDDEDETFAPSDDVGLVEEGVAAVVEYDIEEEVGAGKTGEEEEEEERDGNDGDEVCQHPGSDDQVMGYQGFCVFFNAGSFAVFWSAVEYTTAIHLRFSPIEFVGMFNICTYIRIYAYTYTLYMCVYI